VNVAILTSRSLRHHFFVNTLAEEHNVVGMVREVKRDLVKESKGDQPTIMEEHLAERNEAESRYFGDHAEPRCPDLLDVNVGETNSPEVFAFLRGRNPDAVLLFGTSIIKPPILSHFEGRIINMHLGLSPYYRGAATNFWPLVNREPECVGATIHHAILKVDGGAILNQMRPIFAADDRAHDIGCKAIIAGARGFIRTLATAGDGDFPPGRPQSPGEGLLFRRRDFSAESVVTMRRNFDTGMISEYLEKRVTRDAGYPLVELGD
jgi:methionyl-tRNA formyltransferase